MWMKHDQNKENTVGRSIEQGLLRCPMCKGRGYFEPSQVANNKLCDETETRNNNTLKLPSLQPKPNTQQQAKLRLKYSLPSIKNEKPENKAGELARYNKRHFDPSSTKQRLTNHQEVEHAIPHKPESRIKTGSSQRMSIVSSNDSIYDRNLIPSPKTPQNPSETLKSSLTKLRTNNWNEAVCALREIVQISRFHPRLLDPSMVIVYRGLISLLKSFRSTVVRTACQATNELFATMVNTQRPEFDELVNVLLLKTADSNKFVRQDANEALDTMVINIPPIHSVRTITVKGTTHKNPAVRSAAARLLVCMVGVVGIDAVYNGSKETRGRIISSAATFMQDGCQDVRNFGKRLMKMLMEHDDFEEVLQAEVNDVLLRRIEKTVITMKYKS